MAGCGDSDDTTSAGGSSTSSAAITGTITVFAAASLTESFTALGKSFEAAHPGTKVTFSFGPSSGLAEQITQGAPADVFASASKKNMTQVSDAGDAANPQDFAKNVMEIAVPPSNPAKVTGVDDLARSGVKVALCQAAVPCGTVAAQVFTNAGITVKPVTEEADVKAVLAKVTLGEVDAGMVYVTDVKSAGDKVAGVEIPADVNASTSYPIAALKGSKNAATAQAFVDYVLSPTGTAALTAAGFQAP
ncbi:molybdate ABC transporter substrate-binding protein [Angustibacter luteus]|uniref:Molybdate ABC transporter substrate-binding protein n=1 Tax=Angustibacter luteus TaxID=658456 RepID=A0ABW1JC82_9ACTN